MAKARLRTFGANIPKLAFRDNARTNNMSGARGSARSSAIETETELSQVNKSQSFKTVFLGDANVGKTCLAKLFVERRVVEQSTHTIGFDHHVKEIDIEGVKVKVQIWDTAGMEQFRNALVTKYYRNTDGIVFVFDITRRATFESLVNWISEVKQYSGDLETLKMVLIGNKQDRDHQRKVSFEEAKAFAARYDMISYFEVSAKSIDTLQHLDDIFTLLAQEMIANREKLEVTQSSKSGIISLSDDWEMIEVPEEAVPKSVYSPQDASIRLRVGQTSALSKCVC